MTCFKGIFIAWNKRRVRKSLLLVGAMTTRPNRMGFIGDHVFPVIDCLARNSVFPNVANSLLTDGTNIMERGKIDAKLRGSS